MGARVPVRAVVVGLGLRVILGEQRVGHGVGIPTVPAPILVLRAMRCATREVGVQRGPHRTTPTWSSRALARKAKDSKENAIPGLLLDAHGTMKKEKKKLVEVDCAWV